MCRDSKHRLSLSYGPPSNELETPQVIEALEPKLMVMSGSRSLEFSSTSDKKCVESLQAPHRSIVHFEY